MPAANLGARLLVYTDQNGERLPHCLNIRDVPLALVRAWVLPTRCIFGRGKFVFYILKYAKMNK